MIRIFPNKSNGIATAALLVTVALAAGQVVVEDFEGSSAGSGAAPTGWVLVDTSGASDASYATSAAGLGSNGAGASVGLAGQVSVIDFADTDISGGYLYNTTNFDLNFALSGIFDFQALSEGTFDDVTFMLGANDGCGKLSWIFQPIHLQ